MSGKIFFVPVVIDEGDGRYTYEELQEIYFPLDSALEDVARLTFLNLKRNDNPSAAEVFRLLHPIMFPGRTGESLVKGALSDFLQNPYEHGYKLGWITVLRNFVNQSAAQGMSIEFVIVVPKDNTMREESLATMDEDDSVIRTTKEAALAVRNRDSPSTGATNSKLVALQQPWAPAADATYNARPIELAPPPLELYIPIFRDFTVEFQKSASAFTFNEDEIKQSRDFILVSLSYYSTKASRHRALWDLTIAGEKGFWKEQPIPLDGGKRVKPDGAVFASNDGVAFDLPIGCSALRNGPGETNCDPIEQVGLVYKQVVSSARYAPIKAASCCPCFLITLSGHQFSVWGAIFADRFYFERLAWVYLAPLSGTGGHLSKLSRGIREVAKLLRCLKNGFDSLRHYYRGLTIPSPRSMKLAPGIDPYQTASRFPYWSSYELDGKTYTITYEKALSPYHPSKTVYQVAVEAEGRSTTKILKFAFTYSKAAHMCLHGPGFAPALHYCEYQETIGMFAVVMDFVQGSTIWGTHQPSHAQGLELRKAVEHLHENNFVFGDLRAPNIILDPDESRISLIDFDWAGEMDTVSYPDDICMDLDMGWHPDVGPGNLIKKKHDLHQLENILQTSY